MITSPNSIKSEEIKRPAIESQNEIEDNQLVKDAKVGENEKTVKTIPMAQENHNLARGKVGLDENKTWNSRNLDPEEE